LKGKFARNELMNFKQKLKKDSKNAQSRMMRLN